MKFWFAAVRSSIAVVALVALAGCVDLGGRAVVSAGGSAQVVADTAARCRAFLSSLSDEQRQKATRPLEDKEATTWHFVPGRYVGVELGMLDPAQRVRALDVVRAMLGASGYARTEAIMALEGLLRERESTPQKVAEHRDPDRYALLVCGTPRADGTFVVRFQGHHVSLRMAVVDGVLAAHTPHFLGSNPHHVFVDGTKQSLEGFWVPLGEEEEHGRAFLLSLDEAQQKQAIVAGPAPPDVLLGPAVTIEGGAPAAKFAMERGIGWSALNEEQRQALWQLVELYAERLRGEHAAVELQRIRDAGQQHLTFAWMGSAEPGEGHYYRVVGSTFAIEYDCTQNGANHVHTVWRDYARDFGGDPLREHLKHAHGR